MATKQRRKWLRKGATRGKCGGCTPVCAPGTVCDGAACQPCTVSCTGTPAECGETLQAAITEASESDALYICPGTYQGIFAPAVSVQLYGAGDGDDPARDTVLDGGDVDTVLTLNVPEATVAGMRITHSNGLAGGIFVASGHTTVLNCTVVENKAIFSGSGLFASAASITIRKSTISDNTSNLGGGGLSFAGVTGEISDCVISGNSSLNGGAGIFATSVTISISGTAITGNDGSTGVSTLGGGLLLQAGTTTLDSACRITGNKAGPGASGGGIYGEDAPIVVLNGATIAGNAPDQCAGTASC